MSQNAVLNWWQRFFNRSESVATTIGVGALLVLVCALAGSAWWTLHTYRGAQERAAAERMQVVSGLLANSAETALGSGNKQDLSALRRTVAEAALNYHLERCRIMLPDGQVVADANPKTPTIRELPEKWPARKPGAVPLREQDTLMPLSIPGRGEATLHLASDERFMLSSAWELLAGIGAIGALGLAALLAVYRLVRAKLRALGAIREALVAVERGETTTSALTLSAQMGPEAGAWNALLEEREKLRQNMLAGKAAERLSTRAKTDGDLASACDALWHGLVLVDGTMKIKYVNGAAAVFLGFKREELNGMDLSKVISDPGAIEGVRGVATGKNRGKHVAEIKRERPARSSQEQGERRGAGAAWGGGVLRLSIRPVRREDSAAAMILIEDVTQQRVADEARNAFVAQATHELRTPLTNMRLYIEQLQDENMTDVAERAKSINVVNQECRRLERIVADMLSVSEIEAGTLRLNRGDVRLAQMMADLKQDFEPQAKAKEINLRFDLPPKLPVLRGDRDKIMLAAHNLIGNAIKYTPTGGQVTVRMEEGKGQFQMEVIDNGIGIHEDEHERVFERFYRAKDKRISGITGSGLGLALAREVVRLHGGDVTLRSQLDKGSTFVMTLPIAAEPAAGAMKVAA